MSASTRSTVSGIASVPTLSEILHASPEEFVEEYTDIAAVNLACAVGLPGTEDLDIPRCVRTLDAMAVLVRQKTAHAWHIYERNPIEFYNSKNVFRVIFMLHILHRQFGVHYNPARIDRSDENFDPLDTGDLFIHGVLSGRRTGTCASFPVFGVAVGRRLGYPLKLVKVPEHLLFRWDDGIERFNVDYNGEEGNIHPDSYYKTWPVEWTPRIVRAQKYARWLSSLTARQEVECFWGHRFLTLNAMEHWEEALECLLAAERFNPSSKPPLYGLRADLLQKMAKRDGLPPEASLLAASFLSGIDLRQLFQAARIGGSPMPTPPEILGVHPIKRRFMDPSTGRFTTLDSFAGNDQDPLSLNKYLYTQADPINGIDPSGRDMSLSGMLATIGVSASIGAVTLPAIRDAYNHSYHVLANGTRESLFTAIFNGEATWDDFSRVFRHFESGYVAGSMNLLDTMTFHQVPTVHLANQGLWEDQGLGESWVGTASNIFAWTGTISLYAAAAVWTWEAAGGGTMDIAVSRGPSPWYIHVKYGVNGAWEQAALGTGRSGLGNMGIYHAFAPTSGLTITGIPALFPQAVMVGTGSATAFSCVTGAIHAFLRGWGLP